MENEWLHHAKHYFRLGRKYKNDYYMTCSWLYLFYASAFKKLPLKGWK
jgi:hypothetical protein